MAGNNSESGNQNFRPATPYSSAVPVEKPAPTSAPTQGESAAPSKNSAVSAAAAAGAASAAANAAKPSAKEKEAELQVIQEEYSLESLQELSLKELQSIAKEAGIDTKGLSKEELVDAIVEEFGIADEVSLTDEEELEGEEIDGEMSIEEAMALLGEDASTEDDFSDVEFEEVEEEVAEGEVEDFSSNN